VSGTGKSTVAKAIARRQDADWLQVDDLRLALQWSDVRLPSTGATEALHFLEWTPDVWQQPAERLRDAMIAVGEAMKEAVAIVAGNHVVQGDPAVIEGDGILPSIVEQPELHEHFVSGQLKVVFVAPTDRDELMRNMINRGRGVPDKCDADLRRIAEMNWLYTAWLVREAEERSIPIVTTRPWESLADRIREIL
jgi:2-phosphoglycerate kinase